MSYNLYPKNYDGSESTWLPGTRAVGRALDFLSRNSGNLNTTEAAACVRTSAALRNVDTGVVDISALDCAAVANALATMGELYAATQADIDTQYVLGGTRQGMISIYMNIVAAFRYAAQVAGGAYVA
jgi:hypothetical protein